MMIRHMTGHGVNPAVLCGILVIGFFLLSMYLILKTTYSDYFYALIPVVLAARLNDVNRNAFLRSCFPGKGYNWVRLLENTLLALPFVICLISNGKYWVAVLLLLSTCLLPFLKFTAKYTYTLPTPFYSHPFEFLVGFRKTLPLILIAYLLTVIAVAVGNFNLGIFSLIVVILLCLSYYIEPESYFYVWCFSLNATQFILEKVKFLLIHTTILCSPVLIVTLVAFRQQFIQILVIQMLGFISIFAVLLSKYANFPKRLPLPEIIILMISLIFSPLLIFIIPYFYLKSQKRLKEILT